MYFLDQQIKQDPVRRWNLPDRMFFGHGACHILAGVFGQRLPNSEFQPVWLKPLDDVPGNHIFVTDNKIAFDYRGYVNLELLLGWYQAGWRKRYPDWRAELHSVDFDLLNTAELNSRNFRGTDQYLQDPMPRAERFIAKFGRYHETYQ